MTVYERFFSECWHCDKSLAGIRHEQEWWQGYCGADCARANLPAGGRILEELHIRAKSESSRREVKVLALIDQLGDDVDFDVIAAKAGCTAQQAYAICLARVVNEHAKGEAT